jgi:hypothetical protein
MDSRNANLERNRVERSKGSPLGWIVGGLFLAALLGLLIFYFGFTDKFNQTTGSDGSTRPNVTTQSAK